MAWVPVKTESTPAQSPVAASFCASVCLPFLKSAQNSDGGWGFRAGVQSRAEPTSWALVALAELGAPSEMVNAGVGFLRSAQLPDGSWPASPEQKEGCWATSLACWALASDAESQTALGAGLRSICDDWPKDLSFVRRMIRRVRSPKEVVSQDDSLRGWGWTPNTASWVEPTAFALLALDRAPKELLPSNANARSRLGKSMLYNRMCPSGGWNCGNPMVYGVAGDPSIPQTVWALLALRDEPNREEQIASLEWLDKNISGQSSKGLASLSLARICLDAYGRAWPEGAPNILDFAEKSDFMTHVPTVAWTCVALSGGSSWLAKGNR